MGKTSSASKQKYNDKVYAQISVRLKKELVKEWENRLVADGITKAEFIRKSIQNYLLKAGE